MIKPRWICNVCGIDLNYPNYSGSRYTRDGSTWSCESCHIPLQLPIITESNTITHESQL